MPVIKEKNPINSHFLEKYLTLFLKLKIVVTGRGTTFNTNLFYNIEYITYICVGHGVCYFKYYLYNHDRIYGIKKNNKLLIPPSDKIISIAKKYGWKDEDIIKINLPRWDKYNSNEISKIDQNEIHCKNNSIFIMFTWRNMKKNKLISYFYIDNILNLITNDTLNEIITNNNITLYLSFHRLIDEKYIKKFKKILIKHKSIELINQNLAEYLNSQKQKENILINTQAPKTHINEPQPQNQTMKNPKFVSNYRTGTNTVIPSHNFNPLKTFNNLSNLNIYTQAQIQAQPNDNYITYNKPESERVTITNDIIQTPKKPFVKKDVDVKYNDFDGSGYVKNYGGVSRPGKDSSGEQKTNQDALVCKTNINNIKDFNIFGVLDGHGPEGHYVSEFASEFIPLNIKIIIK